MTNFEKGTSQQLHHFITKNSSLLREMCNNSPLRQVTRGAFNLLGGEGW